jgi:hypothetical protein
MGNTMSGENLDLSSGTPYQTGQNKGVAGRPYVGVHFACCDVYARVYINRDQTGYDGCCPKCLRKVHFRIAPHGTTSRIFTAY